MTALSGAAVELLAAVERQDVTRMPGGRSWNVAKGRYLSAGEATVLRAALLDGLVRIEPASSPSMDREYLLTASGFAALAAAREAS